jgi:hypothetical protein
MLLLLILLAFGKGEQVAANCETCLQSTPVSSMVYSGVIVIQGIFDSTGERLLELKPLRRYTYHSGPIPDQREGRFAVRVAFASGITTTVHFDALVADDAGRMAHGFFEVVVPVSDEIASICITDASGRKIFACVSGAQIAP